MAPTIFAFPKRISFVAAFLIAAGLSAAPAAWGQSATSASRLQLLVNDAAAQLRLSYRQDPAERQLRHDEIGRAIAAWNRSARSESDNELLAEWLRQAMRTSMPGSREPLPAVPEFQRLAPPASATPRAKPPVAAPQSNTTESAPTESLPQSQPANPADRIEKGTPATDIEKERPGVQPAEPTLPGSPSEKAVGTIISPVGSTTPAAEKPTATQAADGNTDDPFRDDPLPMEKK